MSSRELSPSDCSALDTLIDWLQREAARRMDTGYRGASEIQRLRGEVERLRSGLQKIASMTRTAATEEVDAWELRQIARDALNLQGE